MPGGGGIGRPLGPSGGREPGGGGTGLPEGPSGGRVGRCCAGGAAVSAGAGAAAAAGAGDWAAGAAGVEGDAGADEGDAAVAGACAGAEGADGADGRDWVCGTEGAGPAAAAGADGADGADVGDWAPGGRAAGAAAAAGAGRLLLIRRGERAGGASPAAPAPAPAPAPEPAAAAAGADSVRAGAFLTGALLAAGLLDTEVSGRRAGASPPSPDPGPDSAPPAGALDLAALVALAAFLAGAGSSGWTGRRKPSASAFRRTRSACASSIEDEWLLTPIPRERASSSPSLLVRPSSLASS